MKKQLLAINIHSFVDVITNSSTELFVCNTDKSIEQVTEMLTEMLNTYNEIEDDSRTFENTFDTPYIYTQEMCDSKDKWAWGYEKQDNVGKLIICSESDNTVPYDLWDDINDLFNAYNCHLG